MDRVEQPQHQQGLPKQRLNAAYLAIALLAFGVALMSWEARARAPLLERIDRLSLAAQTQWRGRLAPASAHPITLVTLDDASLQRLGTFAPDRRLLAQAIDRLTAADAQLIALDILLLEPARPDPASDAVLAQTMQASGRVLIPFAFAAQGPASADFASNVLLGNAFTRFSDEAAQRRVALLPTRLVAPIAPLADAAVAMAMSPPSAAATVRSEPGRRGLSLAGAADCGHGIVCRLADGADAVRPPGAAGQGRAGAGGAGRSAVAPLAQLLRPGRQLPERVLCRRARRSARAGRAARPYRHHRQLGAGHGRPVPDAV